MLFLFTRALSDSLSSFSIRDTRALFSCNPCSPNVRLESSPSVLPGFSEYKDARFTRTHTSNDERIRICTMPAENFSSSEFYANSQIHADTTRRYAAKDTFLFSVGVTKGSFRVATRGITARNKQAEGNTIFRRDREDGWNVSFAARVQSLRSFLGAAKPVLKIAAE